MATQYKYLVTNGGLGTDNQFIVRYSVHPNGRRALINAIQDHANRTGLESWATPWAQDELETKNRYYPRTPNN